jgi:hypothetical protein
MPNLGNMWHIPANPEPPGVKRASAPPHFRPRLALSMEVVRIPRLRLRGVALRRSRPSMREL